MSDAIVLDVADTTPVRLDAGDADPIAREEIAELTERVTTVEGDMSGLSTRVGAAEGDISTLGTTVDGIDARVEAIEADGSVTTAKLADGAVTTPKLADGAVTDAKLAQEVKSALDTYCGLNFGESLEIISDEYVDGGGRIASDSHFSRTRAFKVFKNAELTVKATGYSTGVSMIATCTESESNVVPRVRSIDSSEHVYSYTPTEDGYVIVSYNHAYSHKIVFGTDASGAYLKNEVLTLSEQMGYPDDSFPLFESGGYIDMNGTKQSSSSFNIYGFVTLDAGDSVSATVRGYNTAVAVIFATNSNHDAFTPLVMCADSTARTYTYTATSKMTIGLCSHTDTPPTYSVARVPLFERVSNASVENSALNPILAFGAITCIGDSLTWSQVYTGASSSRQAYNPYPKVIEHLTGVPTSYIARPGASPAGLWSDSESDIVAKDGQLTIIYLGTNNGLTDTMDTDMAGDDYTTWASTETGCYGKFIAKSLSVNSRVVLVKVHSSSGNVDTTNTVIEKMGQRFDVPVLSNEYLNGDIYHNWPNGQGRNGTHYNDFGYAQFAKNIVGKINDISVADLLNMIPA